MIARVATFHELDTDKLDPAAVEQLQNIMKGTAGYVAGFHLRDPNTGKAVLLAVYESREALENVGEALARQPNVDPVGIDPDEIDYYSDVIQF
jgi:hypothetical protein